ncbi:hypothetical protein GP486_006305 [Trichoglossum hirsutum]|uniref:Uncharacterized protein n=1 Tax=Trichoglossum hirsutum TaxID=265104 RepID=A0A9P8IDX4_9PEZI|nr:hypothetical protein GP486_006305 [Trichoglossum hirsutum]
MWFCHLCRFSIDLDLGSDSAKESATNRWAMDPWGHHSVTEGPDYPPELSFGYNAESSLLDSSSASAFLFDNPYGPGFLDDMDHTGELQRASSSFSAGPSWLAGSSLLGENSLQNFNIKHENLLGRSSVS